MRLAIDPWQVRSFRDDDAAALARYANNPRIAAQLRDRFPHPYRESDAVAWLEHVRDEQPETHFAIASATEPIGAIGLEPQDDVHRRSAEIGYWIGEPFWGRGIATRAVRALTRWAFDELDLVRLFAAVYDGNPASRRVLEKAGYEFEGRLRHAVVKDGRLIDQLLYAAVRADWSDSPTFSLS